MPSEQHLPPPPRKVRRPSSVYSRQSILSNGAPVWLDTIRQSTQTTSLFAKSDDALHTTSHQPDSRPATPLILQPTRYHHSESGSRGSSRQSSATNHEVTPSRVPPQARTTPNMTFFHSDLNDDSGMSINIANLPPPEAYRNASFSLPFPNPEVLSRDPSALDVPLLRSASTCTSGDSYERMGPEEPFDDQSDDHIGGNRAITSHLNYSTHLSEPSSTQTSRAPSPPRTMRAQHDEATSQRSQPSNSSAHAYSSSHQSRPFQPPKSRGSVNSRHSANPRYSIFPPTYHDILVARAREEASASNRTPAHIRDHMRFVPPPLRLKKSVNLHKRSKSGGNDGAGKNLVKGSQSQPNSPTERLMAAFPLRKMSLRHGRHRSEETKGPTSRAIEEISEVPNAEIQRGDNSTTDNLRGLHETNEKAKAPATTPKSTHTKNPSTSSNKSTRKQNDAASPTKPKKSPTARSPILDVFFPTKSPTHASNRSLTGPEIPLARPRPAPEPEKLQQLGDALGKARQELAAVRSGNIDDAISLARNDENLPAAYAPSAALTPRRGMSVKEARGMESTRLQKKGQTEGSGVGSVLGTGTWCAGQEGKLARSKSLLGRRTKAQSEEMRREKERERLKRSIRLVGVEH